MCTGISEGGAKSGARTWINGRRQSRRLAEVCCDREVTQPSRINVKFAMHAQRLSFFHLTSCLVLTGNQATLQYQQTMTFIKPLYKLLKQKQVHPEMVAGLYMIVQAIKQRNYLHAYDVYMRLAIGRPPGQYGGYV